MAFLERIGRNSVDGPLTRGLQVLQGVPVPKFDGSITEAVPCPPCSSPRRARRHFVSALAKSTLPLGRGGVCWYPRCKVSISPFERVGLGGDTLRESGEAAPAQTLTRWFQPLWRLWLLARVGCCSARCHAGTMSISPGTGSPWHLTLKKSLPFSSIYIRRAS